MKLSVLLPFKNCAAYLSQAIQSVQKSSLRDWELVLVHDHSNDGSLQIAANHAAEDPRLRLLHNPGRGLPDALNYGLESARCEWVARMDGDDVCHPERLEVQCDYLSKNSSVTLVSCRVEAIGEPLNEGGRRYLQWVNQSATPEDIFRDLFVESPLPHPSVMYRKSEVLKWGGYRKGLPEDYDLWIRLKEAGHTMAKLPQTLFYWRDHPDRLSRTSPHYSAEAFENLRRNHLLWYLKEELPGRVDKGHPAGRTRENRRHPTERTLTNEGRPKPLCIWGAGKKGGQFARWIEGQGFAVAGFLDIDSNKIGSQRLGKPVWEVPLPLNPSQGPPPQAEGCLIIGHVGSWDAREHIRSTLLRWGKAELRDFVIL